MTALDRVLGVVLPIGLGAGIVWASHLPLRMSGSSDAVLRLAWGARPERIETCRELTAEERANVPQHMQLKRTCEGTSAEYRLVVRDGQGVRVDRTIRGGGLRRDRRLYVFEELPLAEGQSIVEVRFERVTPPAEDDDDDEDEADMRDDGERDDASESGGRLGAIPPSLTLRARVAARRGEVVLVTYDSERRRLIAVQPGR